MQIRIQQIEQDKPIEIVIYFRKIDSEDLVKSKSRKGIRNDMQYQIYKGRILGSQHG